jgi:hypothetical protein
MEPPAASPQVLHHNPGNEPAHVDALVALHTKRRAPEGKTDVVGEIVVSVPLIAHAIV